MEGGSVGVGPIPSNSLSHKHSHSRPVRTSSRYYYGPHSSSYPSTTHPAAAASHFSGPVRRWEKKWVHVAPSQPSPATTKPKKSNGPNSPKSPPLLLCKWTPLSRPPTSTYEVISGHLPRRKFRYTPLAVFEEQKKLASKRVADKDDPEEAPQSEKRLAMNNDDIYGMLDMDNDLMRAHEGIGECRIVSQYSRRSQLNQNLN